MQMNEEQLWSIWKDLSATPLSRILQVVLEAVLQNKSEQVIGQGDHDIQVDMRRKKRGGDLLKLGRTNEGKI